MSGSVQRISLGGSVKIAKKVDTIKIPNKFLFNGSFKILKIIGINSEYEMCDKPYNRRRFLQPLDAHLVCLYTGAHCATDQRTDRSQISLQFL